MSALAKLKDLMMDLKVIEHDRWDTAAHAVLELEHKFGFGGAAPMASPEADPKAAEEIAELRGEVAHLREQVEKLAPLLQVVEEAKREAALDPQAGVMLLGKGHPTDTPEA